MLRKVGLTTALLLALPAFANAWTIAAKVGGGLGSITSDKAAGTVQKTGTVPVMGYFKTATNSGTDTTQVLTFTPVNANYKVSTVLVDGVNKGAVNSVSVAMGLKPANHSVVVYYTAVTYTLTVNQPAAGGSVTIQHISAEGAPKGYGPLSRTKLENLKDGDWIRVTAMANADYKVTSVAGVSFPGLAGENVPYDIRYDHNVATNTTATFALVPQVKARLLIGTAVTSVNGYPGTAANGAYATGVAIPVDVTKSSGNGAFSTELAAYSVGSDHVTLTPLTEGFTFNGKTSVAFANTGTYVVKLIATATDDNTVTSEAYSPIIKVVSPEQAAASACTGCHENRNPDVMAETRSCLSCHGPAPTDPKVTYHENGKVTEAAGKFGASKHWNNHFEYGDEFTGPDGAEQGYINPNESYTTYEKGKLTTCSTKCHFKNIDKKGVQACDACHSDGLLPDGNFQDATTTHGGREFNTMKTSNTCDYCHSGDRHGKIPKAFYGSKHWLNSNETSYYNSDQDFGIFYNGAPTLSYPSTEDPAAITKIDPNVSWNVWEWNAEDGKPTKAVTCAVKCHFRPNLGTDPNIIDSETYDASGKVVRTGRDACMACHDPHQPESIKGVNVCVTCHKGGHHETTTHKTNHAAVTNCLECHDPHTLKTGLPHSNYTTSLANPGYRASYVTPRTTCETCHWAGPANDGNDAVRKAWAESGHGDYAASAWKNSTKHDWKSSGAAADFTTNLPAEDCVRCHTAAGYAQFATSGYSNVNALVATDKESEPLTCNACHTGTAGARLTVGAVATSYDVKITDAAGNTVAESRVSAEFPNVGDSNLCVTCHAGRISGSNLAELQAVNVDWSNISFQNSHYMPAAGLMYMKSGFINFTELSAKVPKSKDGQALVLDDVKTYEVTLKPDVISTPGGIDGGQSSVHRAIGTIELAVEEGDPNGETPYLGTTDALSQQGPCVNCHIQAYHPNKGDAAPDLNPTGSNLYPGDVPATRPGAGHSLTALDQETIKQICLPCHAHTKGLNLENFMQYKVNPAKYPYQDTNELIKKVLLNKFKISYNKASYPYFFDESLDAVDGKKPAVKDWTRGGTLTADQAYKLHGACFNLNLLAHDPGGYVHARTYTQRLQYDTIDFLDDMAMNFSALATARGTYPEKFYGDNANTGYVGTAHPVASEGMLWLSGTHPNNNEIDPPDNTSYIRLKLRP